MLASPPGQRACSAVIQPSMTRDSQLWMRQFAFNSLLLRFLSELGCYPGECLAPFERVKLGSWFILT